jgi:hypothetical protein
MFYTALKVNLAAATLNTRPAVHRSAAARRAPSATQQVAECKKSCGQKIYKFF